MAKALIISADDDTRHLYEIAIIFQQIKVETVQTVKEAAGRILADDFDLVILDLETVALTSLTGFNEVKKKKPLPMIIMTNLTEDEAKKQACVLGVCHVLAQKKATVGNLIRKTREVIK